MVVLIYAVVAAVVLLVLFKVGTPFRKEEEKTGNLPRVSE